MYLSRSTNFPLFPDPDLFPGIGGPAPSIHPYTVPNIVLHHFTTVLVSPRFQRRCRNGSSIRIGTDTSNSF